MKIYGVHEGCYYEGGYTSGLFSTREKAIEYILAKGYIKAPHPEFPEHSDNHWKASPKSSRPGRYLESMACVVEFEVDKMDLD